jgi:hypothetical protein
MTPMNDANKELQNLRNQAFNCAIELLQGAVEEDNSGQIVIYTGLMFDKQGNVLPWTDEENTDE